MMANAGGAWDNAKEHVEGGAHGGKGSEAHGALVVAIPLGTRSKTRRGRR